MSQPFISAMFGTVVFLVFTFVCVHLPHKVFTAIVNTILLGAFVGISLTITGVIQ